MVLSHTGLRGKLLEISCEEFSITLTGYITDKKAQALNTNINTPAYISINGEYKSRIVVKTCTEDGQLVNNNGITMMPCFYENGKYQLILENRSNDNYEIFHMDNKLNDYFEEIGNCLLGIIDFSSDIGYSTFGVKKNGKSILSFTIEVFPSKLDYYKDYKEIIREINDEICSLAFELIGKTYLSTKLKDTKHQTNSEFINILKLIFDDIEKAIKRIEKNPKHNLVSVHRVTDAYRSKRASRSTIAYVKKHPNVLVESEKGFINIGDRNFITNKVVEEKKFTTTDIYENQFVKYIIKKIIQRLKFIEKNINTVYKEENPYAVFILEKRIILEKHLKHRFNNVSELTGKKTMSLVFQMAPGYKEFYKKYMMLNKGLALGEDLYKTTPKKLYSLYEMWCYIKIHNILSNLGYTVEEYGILQYKDNGVYFSLLQDKEAKMVYSNNKNKLELWYNKSYTSPTTNQRPDTVLCIRRLDSSNDNRIYIFDAKYRVNVDDNGTIGPMEEDINVMHRYRDSIVSKLDDSFQFKYETFGAYVMFPYGDEKAFINHKFYKSIEEVNIGAFPMLPGSTKLITNHLERIINQSALEAKGERILIDEYDDYAKFKLENVMVVNVKDKEHFKSYYENAFYHIPASRLKDVKLGVEYLAFYQSKNSFGSDAGIRYYGKIKEIYKYKRKECLEIPSRKGTEDDIYIRINVEYLKEARKVEPIQAGTQLITYTTLYLLFNAGNMHELKLKSNLEINVYKKLKNIAKEKHWKIRKENNKYIIGNNSVEIIEDHRIKVNGKFTSFKMLDKMLL
ncbi:MAG: restriction endonuclease-like protein [Bacillota bacterium]|nr:restriction endonuclease-like protein [Bacillota bacterium]